MKIKTLIPFLFLTSTLIASDAITEISLEDAIYSALANNFTLSARYLDPEISEQRIIQTESEFTSEIFASANLNEAQRSTTFSTTTGTTSDSRNYRVGIRRKFSPGTIVTASTNLNRRDSNAGVNTSALSQDAALSLQIIQPLLRNRGTEANLASVYRAEANFAESKANLQESVNATIASTERAYWNVALALARLDVQETSLKLAEELVQETIKREEVGLATRIDLLEAQSGRAERAEALILAKSNLSDAIDDLFVQMGLLGSSNPLPESIHTEKLPAIEMVQGDFNDFWTSVRSFSPSVTAAEAAIEAQEWNVTAARHDKQPNLDLSIGGAYTGVDDEESIAAYDRAFARDDYEWSIGLLFSLPWGFKGEGAALSIAEKQFKQAELNRAAVIQNLLQSARRIWRDLESTKERAEAAQLTVELREATFAREQEKQRQGLSVFRDLLERQRDLDQARIRLIEARFSYRQAYIDARRFTGQFFSDYNLEQFPEN